MPNDAAVAAPSAAASETTLSVPNDAAGYAEWRMKGTLPTKTEAPAASTEETTEPTKKGEAATSKESSEATTKKSREPESAPDPESGTEPAKKHGKLSAKEREVQLKSENEGLEKELARRKQLKRELESLDDKGEPKKAAPSATKPAPVEQQELKAPEKPVKPARPNEDDFTSFEAFSAAEKKYQTAKDKYDDDVIEYAEKLSDFKASKAIADERAHNAKQATLRTIAEKVEAAKTRYSDLDAGKIDDAAGTIFSDQQVPMVVKKMIGGSTVMVDLLYVMTSDPAKFQSFIDLAKRDDAAATRELLEIERLVKEELASGKSTKKAAAPAEEPEFEEEQEEEAGETKRNDKGQFQSKPEKQVPEKKITGAPPPPEEVGSRGSRPPDEVESAAKRNDFRAFREAGNRKDLARSKGL